MNLYKALIVIFLSAFLVGGFFLTLNSINSLRSDVQELGTAIELLSKNPALDKAVVSENSKSDKNSEKNPVVPTSTEATAGEAVIPTAITFTVQSSPILQPQARVSIIIESVSKNADGKVAVAVKIFTNEAASYSALNIRDLFELVDFSTANQKSAEILGKFDSLPPKSVVKGVVNFKIEPQQSIIILQVNADNDLKHYEFDFLKKSYKETVLG